MYVLGLFGKFGRCCGTYNTSKHLHNRNMASCWCGKWKHKTTEMAPVSVSYSCQYWAQFSWDRKPICFPWLSWPSAWLKCCLLNENRLPHSISKWSEKNSNWASWDFFFFLPVFFPAEDLFGVLFLFDKDTSKSSATPMFSKKAENRPEAFFVLSGPAVEQYLYILCASIWTEAYPR